MRKLTLTVTLLAVVAAAYAQQEKTNYWVVETNNKTAKESIVKIYDANNNVVQEMKVDRMIDITKRKERKRLNKMLKDSGSVLWSKR